MIRERLTNGQPRELYLPILSQIRPEILRFCENAVQDSERLAREWLERGMLKNQPELAREVARELASGERYRLHGNVINYVEAKRLLGDNNVELIPNTSKLWQPLWELYIRTIMHFQEQPTTAKLFETETSSTGMNIELLAAPPRPTPPRPPTQTQAPQVPQVPAPQAPQQPPAGS